MTLNDNIEEEHIAGRKFDNDKPRWDLLPLKSIEQVVQILTFGAQKYDDNNWKLVEPLDRYFAAAMRHITAHRQGEYLDSESGLPHLAHAITNLIFLNERSR